MLPCTLPYSSSIFKKDCIYLLLEKVEGWEKMKERDIDVQKKHQLVAFCMPLNGDLAHSAGMCPDWESNRQPFTLQDDAQSTEPHQSGLRHILYLRCAFPLQVFNSSALRSNSYLIFL